MSDSPRRQTSLSRGATWKMQRQRHQRSLPRRTAIAILFSHAFPASCVARDADRAVGAVLRALYKNEASFALRVNGLGHVTAVCAGAHAAEHVADVHHADVGGLLGEGSWRGRACSASTIAVHADRFIFVVIG